MGIILSRKTKVGSRHVSRRMRLDVLGMWDAGQALVNVLR